jgi:hypothetical protein
MTSGRLGRRIGGGVAWALAGMLACAPAARASTPTELYYQRLVMAAADARCGLFSPPLRTALVAAQAQARGAALRAGADADSLARTMATARARAGSAACGSKDLSVASERVRQAFDGYLRVQRMSFTGDLRTWEAARAVSRDTWTWRLSQSASFGPDAAVFGIAAQGADQPLTAVAGFADGGWPYAARLVMRDPDRSPAPSALRLKRGSPLSSRTPHGTGARIVLAQSRSIAEARLAPAGVKKAIQFRFPVEAAETLQTLDPREAVAIEFLFSGPAGETVRTAYFEVGDFTAATAFLKVASR